jgi:hypothetical protein
VKQTESLGMLEQARALGRFNVGQPDGGSGSRHTIASGPGITTPPAQPIREALPRAN